MEESHEARLHPPMWARKLIFLLFTLGFIGFAYLNIPAEQREPMLAAMWELVKPLVAFILFALVAIRLYLWAS